jgi:hypothetical protein
MHYKIIFLFVGLLAGVTECVAQSFFAVRRDRDLIVSFGTGTSTYFGEFQNPGDNIDAKPSINIGVQLLPTPRFLLNRLNVRSELTYFRLQGTDATANDDRVERNLNFFSNNFELNLVGMLHLFPQDKKFYRRSVFNIYGLTGIGLMYMNPKTKYLGATVTLQPLQTEGIKYARFQFVVPYGFGIRFRSGLFYNVAIEAGWRKTFTDYMDDASSTRYPDPDILQGDLSRALSDRRKERDPNYPVRPGLGKRGNPENKDSYMLLNVKFEYYLPIDMFTDDDRLMWVKRKKPRRR